MEQVFGAFVEAVGRGPGDLKGVEAVPDRLRVDGTAGEAPEMAEDAPVVRDGDFGFGSGSANPTEGSQDQLVDDRRAAAVGRGPDWSDGGEGTRGTGGLPMGVRDVALRETAWVALQAGPARCRTLPSHNEVL